MDFFSIVKQMGRPIAKVERLLDQRLRARLPARKFPELILYYFVMSPYSAKVRHFLAKHNIEITQKDILESDEAYLELMTGGKVDQVPCLRTKDQWRYESDDIIRYLSKLI